MTGNETAQLAKQVEHIGNQLDETRAEMKAGFNRLEKALGGDIDDPDSKGGVMGRLRAQEEQVSRHDERIASLETWRESQVKQAVMRQDYNALATKVDANTKWRESLTAQWRLLMLLGGGNLLGLLGVLYALAQLVARGAG